MSNQNNAPSADKLKALQLAMDKIEKDHGKGTIMKLGDDNIEDVSVIPSGSIGLNAALGVGGYPRGRIIEIYGPESSGKTTLAIHAIRSTESRRHSRYHRRRTRFRQILCKTTRSRRRQPAHIAARLGRTGTGDSRPAHPLFGIGYTRNRLCGSPYPKSRARRRYGRQQGGSAGSSDVASSSQTNRLYIKN